VNDEWLDRWQRGQTGWHEANGSSALRKFWPHLAAGSRVLVPLCGKSADLLWLEQRGCHVTGVELSDIAVRSFFAEAGMDFEVEESSGLSWFRAPNHNLTIVRGDYFQYVDEPHDALYDRAALVALPPQFRRAYVEHTGNLLKTDARQLLITLEYDQSRGHGPPFSVLADEVRDYWPWLRRAGELSAVTTMPPKFRDAGISEFVEAVWLGERV
jgi:thiopurine S-methyltransferase